MIGMRSGVLEPEGGGGTLALRTAASAALSSALLPDELASLTEPMPPEAVTTKETTARPTP